MRLIHTTGIELFGAERKRQVVVKGYNIQNDEFYSNNELVDAALAYLTPIEDDPDGLIVNYRWPWGEDSFKRDPASCGYFVSLRDMVKAGALLAAEVDRRMSIEWETYGEIIESHDSESVTRHATGIRADGQKFIAVAVYQHDEFIELLDIEETD